jgi:carbamoyltransferase
MGSELDVLVVENCYLVKEQQDPALKLDYRNVFDPD